MKSSMVFSAVMAGILSITGAVSTAESDLPDSADSTAVDEGMGTDLNATTDAEQSPAPSDLLAVPEPPEVPEAVQSGEALEPEVTIIQRDENTIEEFRINGWLFKVKITPSSGPAYYLIDTDGDGLLETRSNNDITDANIPQWVLFNW